MKQTLRNYKPVRLGSITFGFLLAGLTVTAQQLPSDSLSVLYSDARYQDLRRKAQSLTAIDFNKGLISNSEQLFTGKFAGLQLSAQGGQPGAGTQIRVHNITSITGSNQPLILLDGVPVNSQQTSFFTGVLNFINPSDIASVTFAKDDATLAVYGSRATNGVLFINTKQTHKSDRIRVQYTSTAAISVLRKKADVLSADQLREVVEKEYPEEANLLGNYSTDWQDVIYRNAYSHDQHLSLSGSILKAVPFRISAGHQNQQGILKTTQSKRNTLGLALNPSFLQDHLKLNLNLGGAQQDSRLAQPDLIYNALIFDPTQPVYQDNQYGNYFAYLDENGKAASYSPLNPLSLLEQQHLTDENNTMAGSAHLQYKFHPLPALKLNLRYSYQATDNAYKLSVDEKLAALEARNGSIMLQDFDRGTKNRFTEAFIVYEHPEQLLQSDISILAGVADATIKRVQNYREWMYNGTSSWWQKYKTERQTRNLFGKVSLLHKSKYGADLAFSSVRESNLVSGNNMFNIAVGGHWNLLKENFMVEQSSFTSLNLYGNLSSFKNDNSLAFVESAPSTSPYYGTLVDPDLKPENIIKLNLGASFGLLDDKLHGKLSYTRSKVKGVIHPVGVSRQTGYEYYLANVADFTSSGLEAAMQYKLVSNEQFEWGVGTTISYNTTNLTKMHNGMNGISYSPNYSGYAYFISRPGQPVNTFRLYEHAYDNNGRPIADTYKRSQNGAYILSEKNSPDPKLLLSVSSDLTYKKLSMGLLFRGSTGNYVFNALEQRTGYFLATENDSYLMNAAGSYLKDGFLFPQLRSTHFLENASFIKLEYIQLGYHVGNLWKDKVNMSLTATAQNALVLTKYKGQDPEVINGVDNGQYSNPATYSLGLKLDI
ncbi:TonB-dependent receptor plug domain-containing protein [Pontibacter fetidus]|uniref:TonB-dependent receptor plug domain-containing protein n=1 Tax=Pontibacter fetidus TaxID=2700082 RepID=A0A6B2GU66_9BACT|nr:TonB-dependent receptor plug domain-containing protein [Pontibacter fetidus]NDK54459.1 TonB-dependent receptor plug domain-containing protein [Pontibacter fetidus]